jgi:hypothetical protein
MCALRKWLPALLPINSSPILKNSSKLWHSSASVLFFLIHFFNSANDSSIGLKSGEYGGSFSRRTFRSRHISFSSYSLVFNLIMYWYFWPMYLGIIHHDYWSRSRIRCTERQNLIPNEFIKCNRRIRGLTYLPSNVSIDRVCGKHWPSFRPFHRLYLQTLGAYRCPPILAIHCAFVCSRFINKD